MSLHLRSIRDIVYSPPVPALSFSPLRDKIIFLKRRALRPLAELATPEEKLAGVRIDGNCNSRSRMSFYTGIGVHQILLDGTLFQPNFMSCTLHHMIRILHNYLRHNY